MKLLSFLKRKKKKETPITRSSKDRENLTKYELQFLSTHAKCPDCEVGYLLQGPCGGASMNVKCDNLDCGSKFNICLPFMGERLSDPSPYAK
jgi:hypothetical protein